MSTRDVGWIATWTAAAASAVTAAGVVWLLLTEPAALAVPAAGGSGMALLNAVLTTVQTALLHLVRSL